MGNVSPNAVFLAMVALSIPLGGCVDDAPSAGGNTQTPAESPLLPPVNFTHAGETGARACVTTLFTLNCPYGTRGEGDMWDLQCAVGNPGQVNATVTWESDGDTAPFNMSVGMLHRAPEDEQWTPELNTSWRSTTSPLVIEVDAGKYAGELLAFYFTGWRDGRVQPADSGALAATGKPFQFEGTYECIRPDATATN